MRELLEAIVQAQLRSGFADLAGAEASAAIPISDRLLNEVIARALPASGALRAVSLKALDGSELAVDLRIVKAGIAVPIHLVFGIERQPELPQQTVLGLRLKKAPVLFRLGGTLVRIAGVLPPWVATDGDRVAVDVEALVRPHDRDGLFRYLTGLRVTTIAGAVVVSVRARIGAAGGPPPIARETPG